MNDISKLPKKLIKNFDARFFDNQFFYCEDDCKKEFLCFLLKNKFKITSKKISSRHNKNELNILENIIKQKQKYNIDFNFKIKLKSHNSEEQLKQLVKKIFFKYDIPSWLIRDWSTTTWMNSIKDSIRIASGESARIVFGLSKKENSLFYNKDYNFQNKNIALTYIIARAQNCDKILAYQIAQQISYKNLTIKYKRVICDWLSKQNMFDYFTIGNIVDYLTSHKNPILKHRNINHIITEMNQWHEKLNQKTKFQKNNYNEYYLSAIINNQDKEYTFLEILSDKGMSKEGKRMHNCIFSYRKSCHENKIRIVSLKSKDANISLEINLGRSSIIQARGFCNSKLTSFEKSLLHSYAKEMNLAISTYV